MLIPCTLKDNLFRYLNYVLTLAFFQQMDPEKIQFGKVNLPTVPKSNLSFQIHNDIKNLDMTQTCISDNLWNARGSTKKLASLNTLSYYFK